MIAFPYEPLRRPQNLVKTENPQDACEHDWQWFREPVCADQLDKRNYDHSKRFWFKTRACVKCKKKQRESLHHETV